MPGYGPAIRLTPWFLRRFISLCVIVVSLFLASGVLAQRVVVLRDGESVSGQLTTSAPVVVYQLDGLASDQINVRATADTNLYPRLSLLDANFNAIAFSSSPLTGSENAREALLTVSLPASGRYSLVVTSASGALGGYTLSLGVTAALTPTTTQILFPLLQTATAWAAGTAPAIPTAQPAALTQAAISGNLGSALETALAETASPTPYCAPNSMLPCNFPTSTPISNTTPTPWPPLMGSFEVPVSSLEPTVFSEIISGPGEHRIRLRFTDLTGPIQPQQFRIALDCDNGIGLLLWQGNDCGDSYTEIIESADTTMPFRDLTLQILALEPPPNVPYQLTITPETPFAAVATPDGDHVFDAFSNQSASFTSDISRPLGDPADRVTVRFPDAVGAQAQTYRFTLTCASGLATALLAGELRCGDSVTQSIGGTNTGEVPVVGFEFAFLDGSLAAYVSYTLTVSPETGLVAQAPPDADFLLNVPLTSQTTFSDEISSPQGDAADKITVRVPDLFTGSWDFTLNLLCDGTGVEFVQWSLQTGQTLACGDSLTLPLTSTSVNPVPNLVMFVHLID